MARLLTTLAIALMAILNTGCSTTVHTGNLWIGAQPTWASNKERPICTVSQNQSWSNKTTSTTESWSCTQTYDLGNDRCTRSWSEYRSSYNAPGRANDSSSLSQYNSPPSCRPMTPAELAERDERRRQAAEAAKAASATKK